MNWKKYDTTLHVVIITCGSVRRKVYLIISVSETRGQIVRYLCFTALGDHERNVRAECTVETTLSVRRTGVKCTPFEFEYIIKSLYYIGRYFTFNLLQVDNQWRYKAAGELQWWKTGTSIVRYHFMWRWAE